MFLSDRASSASPCSSSLTSCPTPVQFCLPLHFRGASIPLQMTQRLRLPCRNTSVGRHHEFLARLCVHMAHDHLSQQGRRACNCADDCEGRRQPPRLQNLQCWVEGEGRVFIVEWRLGGGTSCMAEADGECQPC